MMVDADRPRRRALSRVISPRELRLLFWLIVIVLVGVIGVIVMLAGLVMLVVPGPGLAAVVLGLVILSTEFRWAQRLVRPVRVWFHRAEQFGMRIKDELLRRLRARRGGKNRGEDDSKRHLHDVTPRERTRDCGGL